MKRYIPLLLGLAVLGLFIFGCDTIVDQEPIHPTFTDNYDNLGKMVPFKGKGTWQMTAEPKLKGDEIECVGTLEGTATHLGLFQGVETGRFKYDEEGLMGMIGEYLWHRIHVIAANGDELYFEGSVEKYGTVSTPHPDGSGFELAGVQILGGTGRFANAEGSYDVCVTFSEDGTATWTMKGEISSVGSTRPGR